MENYEVGKFLGEGSFGRVYKAKQISTGTIVAFKIISKRGRSKKELKLLRRECEIQRQLHHPNIIQMLDSFETTNEIVVITEFAHEELNVVLEKKGHLAEEHVQKILWDLLSALYYLHSHRVLHRDLKPQNILLDAANKAKLCDFGFARNMSIGTHVLTSIKGTPLYMAPELIYEHPYDHTADLWSLGCITYEMIEGKPPFSTTSILHLIRIIRHDQIVWPTTVSDHCLAFLKGLLQKDPNKRLTWPDILKHPFVEGHIFILDDAISKPLTRPLSLNTLELKEQQKMDKLTWKVQTKLPIAHEPIATGTQCDCANEKTIDLAEEKIATNALKRESESSQIRTFCFHEDSNPIENDEWLVFLRQTIEEVMNGETELLYQASFTNIIVSPLQNANTSADVLYYVAALLSLPFVVPSALDERIKQTYIEIKLLPNLVYATKLLMKKRREENTLNDLSANELKALEHVYLLICYLIHCDMVFLLQLCDAIVILNMQELWHRMLFLGRREVKIVVHLITILTHILRSSSENAEIVEQILLRDGDKDEIHSYIISMLRHSNCKLRERLCFFLQYLGRSSKETLKKLWDFEVKETLEILVFDSIDTVRNAAEESLQQLNFLDLNA